MMAGRYILEASSNDEWDKDLWIWTMDEFKGTAYLLTHGVIFWNTSV